MAAMTNLVTFVAGLLFGSALYYVAIRPVVNKIFSGEWHQ